MTTPKQGDGTSIPAGGVLVGSTVKDSALVTVTGATAVSPVGDVDFWICQVTAPALCDTGGTFVGTTTIPAGSPNPVTVLSPGYVVPDVGRYCWRAEYSGDVAAGIPGSSDSSATECFNVISIASAMTTAQSWVPRDSATISAAGGGALAGTVSFALYASGDCAVGGDSPIYSTTRPVAGTSPQTVNTVDSATQPAAQDASGSYSWSVAYASTNPAQDSIAASCKEVSSLSIDNDNTFRDRLIPYLRTMWPGELCAGPHLIHRGNTWDTRRFTRSFAISSAMSPLGHGLVGQKPPTSAFLIRGRDGVLLSELGRWS